MANDPNVDRRSVLRGLGVLALAPGIPQAHAERITAETALQSSTPSHSSPKNSESEGKRRLSRFLRMRTSPDGAPVLWVYSGVLVVKPEGEVARPVARIAGLSKSLATSISDDRWLWTLDEAGYFCDLESGGIADELINPFTGRAVRPRHYRSPQKLIFGWQNIVPGEPLDPKIEFRGEITELARIAGTIAMTEDLYVKLPAVAPRGDQPGRPARFAASLATFSSKEIQFSRPDTEWMECQFNYTTLNSIVGWLEMSAVAGVQDMRLIGVKIPVSATNLVPSELLRRVSEDHPGLLDH